MAQPKAITMLLAVSLTCSMAQVAWAAADDKLTQCANRLAATEKTATTCTAQKATLNKQLAAATTKASQAATAQAKAESTLKSCQSELTALQSIPPPVCAECAICPESHCPETACPASPDAGASGIPSTPLPTDPGNSASSPPALHANLSTDWLGNFSPGVNLMRQNLPLPVTAAVSANGNSVQIDFTLPQLAGTVATSLCNGGSGPGKSSPVHELTLMRTDVAMTASPPTGAPSMVEAMVNVFPRPIAIASPFLFQGLAAADQKAYVADKIAPRIGELLDDFVVKFGSIADKKTASTDGTYTVSYTMNLYWGGVADQIKQYLTTPGPQHSHVMLLELKALCAAPSPDNTPISNSGGSPADTGQGIPSTPPPSPNDAGGGSSGSGPGGPSTPPPSQ